MPTINANVPTDARKSPTRKRPAQVTPAAPALPVPPTSPALPARLPARLSAVPGPLPVAPPIPAPGQTCEAAPDWPVLAALGLSHDQQQARTRAIGRSDATTTVSSAPERIVRLWREKRGEAMPEDLSANLAVMLGCWSEAFNRQ